MLPRIGIIGDALAPDFNEAFANQMYLLSQRLRAPVLTGNNLGLLPFKRMGQYFIVNTRFLRNGTPLLSLLNGAFFYPFVKWFERRFDVIYISAGIDSGFLSYLHLEKCIPIVNTIPFTNEDKEAREFTQKFAPRLRCMVAQSKRVKVQLMELGVDPERIHLIYPWVDLNRFRYSPPPPLEEFRLIFASPPNMESDSEDVFTAKGVPLLLEAFTEFAKHNEASLCLLWRGYYNKALYSKISELGLEGRVRVINEVADMPKLYAESHATLIPFLDTRRSPEIPLSAVESLACGRPVITTDVAELAQMVGDYKCGCVTKPSNYGLISALETCKMNYSMYQQNCRRCAEELFDFNEVKLESILQAGKGGK